MDSIQVFHKLVPPWQALLGLSGQVETDYRKVLMPRPLIDMTGQKYGDLTVLSISHIENREGGGTIVHWKCQCACGKITYTTRTNLRRKQTRSCGCQTAKFRKSVKWRKFSEKRV